MKLVVVESPAKARTFARVLGDGYEVLATGGHVMDLPPKALGVDTDNDFAPSYAVLPGKKKILAALKHAATTADEVLLATDPDREGEVIARHVADYLAEVAPVYRVRVREVTAAGIQRALAAPGAIDGREVEAQQARRVMDRLIGYRVSAFLQRHLPGATSAGRVQTTVLRLLCEREHAIARFTPKPFHTLTATLRTMTGDRVEARLVQVHGLSVGGPDKRGVHRVIAEKDEAQTLVREAKAGLYRVARVLRQAGPQPPPPPLTTAALQREAGRHLKLNVKQTMFAARQLFEGVALENDEPVGLITYPRTDSERIADEIATAIRHLVTRDYGPAYLGAAQTPTKKRHAQDAHEALRPTDVERTPRTVRKYLTPAQYRVYKLIWERAVASQMAPADVVRTTVDIASEGNAFVFRMEGTSRPFRGFLQVHEATDVPPRTPDFTEGQGVAIDRLVACAESTTPPAPYTEADLVEQMESHGLGRPATYQATLQTLLDRRYATIQRRTLRPTELGLQACRLLVQHAPRLFDVPFTARMEQQLDRIAEGRTAYPALMAEFYRHHQRAFTTHTTSTPASPTAAPTTTGDCPHCGKRLVRRRGRHGAFLACPGFPDCRHTERESAGDGAMFGVVPALSVAAAPTGKTCACGGKLVVRHGARGPFYGCTNFPGCRHTEAYVDESQHVGCPSCHEGHLVAKQTKTGKTFYGCSSYPTCEHAVWQRPVKQRCTSCGNDHLLAREDRSGGERLACPRCNATAEEAFSMG